MIIVMARIIMERENSVLIEPYGTYDDWFDEPQEDLHKWIPKSKIITIDDEEVDIFDQFLNTADALEIAMPNRVGESLL